MARRSTSPVRGGRRPTAAAPRWGFTCFLCPDRPSVLVEVTEPGDPGSQDEAWALFSAHLAGEEHQELLTARRPPFTQLGEVSLRAHAGPTAQPAQAA